MSKEFDPEQIAEADAPDGFRPLPFAEGFIEGNGPIFVRPDSVEPVFGVRVVPRMCNPLGVIHGGMVATLLDMALPLTLRFQEESSGAPPRFLLTVNLTVDFLAGARIGSWLEARSRVLRQTGRMAFIDGTLSTREEGLVARGSGVFRLGKAVPEVPPLVIADDQAGS
ncbi:hypothetical protein B5C34_05090 [Pacificimonas flava]|uniref:Thioesterase domain-containing protein n=2 Tax=Pacificimonas TaxID=1960290 RepID=A0A219B548_9SPHN|nr:MULTISPECIES: PaaI family thioesterase [Pacificimonas]MBZ6377407.1 PaaI family thioesterase [Pacificimonas aurantium]OWV32888.1 hypothetical protein B5C34_05090 [Pacificimonas flava]